METVLLYVRDDALYFRAVKSLLAQKEFLIVQRIRTPEHLAFAIQYHLPQLIITDWYMDGYDCISLLPFFRSYANTRILIYSEFCVPYHVNRAQQSGFVGFVSQRDGLDALAEAFRYSASLNDRFFVCGQSDQSLRTWEKLGPAGYLLSPRLQWVLGEIGCGANDADIGNRLQRKACTIKNERQMIMVKLDLHTAPELMRYALLHGFTWLHHVPKRELGALIPIGANRLPMDIPRGRSVQEEGSSRFDALFTKFLRDSISSWREECSSNCIEHRRRSVG